MSLAGVVMAAGEGKRMISRIPKPLHKICGKEMVCYPLEMLKEAGANRVVVVVSPGNHEAVRSVLGDEVEYAVQEKPDGTGGAVASCYDLLKSDVEDIIVIGADTVLVTPESLGELLNDHAESEAVMSLLSAPNEGQSDLGRVAVSKGRVTRIVEASESFGTRAEKAPLVNAGVYCFNADWLWRSLKKIRPRESGEFYLTDLARIGSREGALVVPTLVGGLEEVLGVNDRSQLAFAEAAMRDRIRDLWLYKGVTMMSPSSIYIDADVTIGMDTVILPNTMITGRTKIGENCEIGPNSVIRDSTIGNDCRVTSSALEEATMEDQTDVGPFSHLRPGASLETGVHIGNYVEVKESRFKAWSRHGALRLCWRRHDRLPGKRWRGHDHLQLRRQR